MKRLVALMCCAVISATAAHADESDNVLSMIAPYCTHAYAGNEVSKCISDQDNALMRLAALKKVRGPIVDGILRLCTIGQYPELGSGVNFVGAFKCVSARISSS